MARVDGLVHRKSGNPVPTSTVHKILRKRIYTGYFDYNGATYQGDHQPLISEELWEQVQAVLDGRGKRRPKKRHHRFAFSGLIRCGHCGCALVGEKKKGRYVYYHCTGHKGKCPEKYTREEVLEQEFVRLLEGISFSQEVLEWITKALRESFREAQAFHSEAITRLKKRYRRLEERLEAMYIDKLDGRITTEFFDEKTVEWRAEQRRIQRDLAAHETANERYLDEGLALLRLAQQAPELFENQEPGEKRKLLDFVVSNCTWKDGKLHAEYRQPFDIIRDAAQATPQGGGGSGSGGGSFDNWRRERDSNPRYGFPYTRFPSVRLQPLGHLSGASFSTTSLAQDPRRATGSRESGAARGQGVRRR